MCKCGSVKLHIEYQWFICTGKVHWRVFPGGLSRD